MKTTRWVVSLVYIKTDRNGWSIEQTIDLRTSIVGATSEEEAFGIAILHSDYTQEGYSFANKVIIPIQDPYTPDEQ